MNTFIEWINCISRPLVANYVTYFCAMQVGLNLDCVWLHASRNSKGSREGNNKPELQDLGQYFNKKTNDVTK